MAPTIHLVRHAQGFHNLKSTDPSFDPHSLRDPELTPEGQAQCRRLFLEFPYHDRIDLFVASPIRRTIYTGLLGFPTLTERQGIKEQSGNKNLRIHALPIAQETSNLPCDTGSDPALLREEFKDEPVDLQDVEDGWNSKSGKYAPTREALTERARLARKWLWEQAWKKGEDSNVLLVTHGGFLHYLTEDWTSATMYDVTGLVIGTGWANCEFRTYQFASDAEPSENYSLVETVESRVRRLGEEEKSVAVVAATAAVVAAAAAAPTPVAIAAVVNESAEAKA